MKKFATALLSIILAGSMLVGCSAKSEKPDASSKAPSSEATASTTDTAKDGPSWKQDTSPTTMEWFVGYDWAAHTFDPANNTYDKAVLDETGVTIKWSYGDLQKLNMLITTDSLPDIVTYNVVSTERLTMENGGLLLPLDKLREQYAPDFNVVQGMMDWYRNEKDGNWYTFASFFYDLKDTEARGGHLESHNMNYARQDIMTQLGIKAEDMQTQDGFVAALKKVKDAKVQYNGVTVEPYIGLDAGFLAEQFGADREDKAGNLVNIMRTPEFKEATLFHNRLWREKLITDEEFTVDNTLRKQKVSSGAVFAGSTKSNINGREDLFAADNKALMTGVGLIAGKEKKTPILSPSATGGWTGTMISKNCKAPERAIRLFAYLSQPELTLAQSYGGIGGYDLVDGEAVTKPERVEERAKDPAAFETKYKSGAQDYFNDFVYIQKATPTKNLTALQEDEVNYLTKYQMGHFYDDKIFRNVNPDGGSELASLSAQIDEYWKQQAPQIVMADSEEKAVALFDKAMKQMDEMGMQKLDDFKNEQFKKNKTKMGIEFAWPRNQK